MVFHEHMFKIAFGQQKKSRSIFRIEEKGEFEKSYHSFVGVQAVRKLREGIRYITKYLTKSINETETQILTLALCWHFKKRSFAVSGDLYKLLITTITKQKHRIYQITLYGKKINNVVWFFIGIFPPSKLGINHNEWWKVIKDKKILSEIFEERLTSYNKF